MYGVAPFSYTHLDVYKRQAYGVAQLIGVTPTRFAVEVPAFEPAMVVRVVLLALACAVVVHLFCFCLLYTSRCV